MYQRHAGSELPSRRIRHPRSLLTHDASAIFTAVGLLLPCMGLLCSDDNITAKPGEIRRAASPMERVDEFHECSLTGKVS